MLKRRELEMVDYIIAREDRLLKLSSTAMVMKAMLTKIQLYEIFSNEKKLNEQYYQMYCDAYADPDNKEESFAEAFEAASYEVDTLMLEVNKENE